MEDVTLDVPEGSLTALLGPSGSGKSTLLRIMAGLETPDSGVVRIGGKDLTDARPQERGIGFVFQHYAAFTHMSVYDNVAFGLKIRKRPKAEIRAKVDELLPPDSSGLTQWGGAAAATQLSEEGSASEWRSRGGACGPTQRACCCSTSRSERWTQPSGAELRRWLRRLHDEQHVTTVLVTHDQEEAMEVADRIAVMSSGTIEQVGSPREIYDHPANEFVMGFVGPVSKVGERLVRPHDVTVSLEEQPGGIEAMVGRVVHLGFEVRVELELPDGSRARAQLTRQQADELEIDRGDIVYIRPPAELGMPVSSGTGPDRRQSVSR